MKCEIIIDESKEEKVIIYAHKKTKLTDSIEQLILEDSLEIIGYKERELTQLNTADIYCFTVEDNKIFALTENDKFSLKLRLYKIEENLPESFVKINQSCIANIKKIEKFDTSISGSLKVIFKNGYIDFVSRRQLKKVKERLGF